MFAAGWFGRAEGKDTMDLNAQPNSTESPAPGMQPSEDWLALRPALRSDLRFEIRRSEGMTNYVIEDSTRRKFFQIGANEFSFIQLLDGKTEVQQALQQIRSTVKNPDTFSDDAAKRIVQWLIQLNLVQVDCVSTSDRIVKSQRQQKTQRLLTFINPLMFKIRLFNPDRHLGKLLPLFSWMFTRWAFAGWLILIAVAATQILQHSERFAIASDGILANGRWIWLIVAWVLLKVVHEMGHGLACKKFGGEANETGVLMLLFTPMAYIDVSSSWRFNSRRQRMIVSFAGMYVEIGIAAIAMLVWCHTGSQVVADICFNIYLMAGITTVLFNANPLMRFDGYYILADGLGIVNLYTRGQAAIQNRIRFLFGLPADALPPLTRTNVAILFYGLLAYFWRITISVGLVIAASTLLSGFGLIFACMGIVLWFLFPIYRFAFQIIQAIHGKTLNRRRLGASLGFVIVIGFAAFHWIQAPALKSAPAIVHFKDERVLRSDSDGFLQQVHVFNGQYVAKDQVLFELDNPELKVSVRKLKLEIEQAKIQAQIHQRNHELASLQAEQENIRSLTQTLAEKLSESDALVIRAPFDGIVVARDLENRVGMFFKRGDDLATIAKSTNKEILVSIDQTDWKSFEQGEGKPVRLGFPGLPLMKTTLDRINPRASDRPIDVTLTAAYGGPIPVRPGSENAPDSSKVVLLGQRFTATIRLNELQSRKFEAGQRGVVYFRTPRQSLGSYLFLASRNWLKRKLQLSMAPQG